MKRCVQCQRGRRPQRVLLESMTVFARPRNAFLVVAKCANCSHPLSVTSLRKLKGWALPANVPPVENPSREPLVDLVNRLSEIDRFTAQPSNLQVVAAVEVDLIADELRAALAAGVDGGSVA